MTAIPVITLETIQASLTEAEILDAVKGALIAQARGEVNSPPPGMLMLDNPKGECHIKYGNYIAKCRRAEAPRPSAKH